MHTRAAKQMTTAAFLVGAASGTVAALLISPETAKRMRERIRSGARNLLHKGEDRLPDGMLDDRQRLESGTGRYGSPSSTTAVRESYGYGG